MMMLVLDQNKFAIILSLLPPALFVQILEFFMLLQQLYGA